MSHASTATITLGGAAPAQPQYGSSTPTTQHYGGSAPTNQQNGVSNAVPTQQTYTPPPAQPSEGNGRRRRQNVPDHMKTNAYGGGGDQFGAVYASKPQGQVVSSTPDQAYQAQTLFPDKPKAQPQIQQPQQQRYQPQQQPNYQPQQQQINQYNHPQPAQQQQQPTQNSMDYVDQPLIDARRTEEARQKLVELNLSPAVIEQYRRKFRVLDLNKDGVVNLREFAAISRVLGYKFSKEEIMEIFGRRDLDDSGGISFDEFVIAMYARAQKTKELAPYREMFRHYDWKGCGYITSDEAFPILKRELGFDENKTEMMIDLFDRNKDYRLSLLEFIDFSKRVDELKVQVRTAFHDFDRNQDGFVDSAEAKAVLIPKGFSDQQVEALIYKYDEDRDGKLNYQEFAAFWDVQII